MNYFDDETVYKVTSVCDYITTLGDWLDGLENQLTETDDKDKVEVLVSEYAAALSIKDMLEDESIEPCNALGDISNGEFELLSADDVSELVSFK